MENVPSKNKGLVAFICCLQIILFIIYGVFVEPTTYGGGFQWLTLLTVVFSVGYIYLTNQQRPFLVNMIGNWIVMWFISFQLYFLFAAMWASVDAKQSVDPYISSSVITATNLPILMLTIAYVNLKGFLSLKEVLMMAIIGTFGFSCTQYIILIQLEGLDAVALSVFLFGAVYGFTIRTIAIPTRSSSPLNKFVDISRDQAMVALLVCLFFFPVIASKTDAISALATANVFVCIVFAILASITLHIGMNWKLHFQTILYVTIASAMIILISPGIIQNLAAPAIVGSIVGLAYSYVREFLPAYLGSLKIPDPSLTTILFVFPTIIGALLSAIFIACYNTPSYNKLGYEFPYPRILQHPFKYGGMQLAVLVVNVLMAVATGLFTGFLMKWLSEMNELEEDTLFWSQKQSKIQGVDVTEPLLAEEKPDDAQVVITARIPVDEPRTE